MEDFVYKKNSIEVEDRFSESKVRDENGILLKVYHFSDVAGIEKFNVNGDGNYEDDEKLI